uniref:Uncharacterized protein n=1 Tax=Rhizophora mucronata TaxID=61149 RepID=A0A2P2QGQ9_RHIMU
MLGIIHLRHCKMVEIHSNNPTTSNVANPIFLLHI